jgi:DNA helicase-2/ATP-dependent DNA helicase PcrA
MMRQNKEETSMRNPVDGQFGIDGFFDLPSVTTEYPSCDTYEEFCHKYKISLNNQQAEAVQAVVGPNLLLAVPGSGKTTVLIARLGYMIICKGISPKNILAMTYTKAATQDMNKRFAKVFGKKLGEEMEFRTINGISDIIVKRYGRKAGLAPRELVADENKSNAIIRQILIKYLDSYPTDGDIKEAALMISYAKNMVMSITDIRNEKFSLKKAAEIYNDYCIYMDDHGLMDYDDQIIYALDILRNNPDILQQLRDEYQYICVDEAQDTSKIQHQLIYVLAGPRANLFMVGDEDQSIYGFRAAFPQALLDFRENYPGGRVLLMERNYRSTATIVGKAGTFIEKNSDRYDKKIIPNRSGGEDVVSIEVATRNEQYEYLLDVIRRKPEDTAIIYRENDSMIPLANLCLKHGLPFKAKGLNLHFFTNKVVQDIANFMRLGKSPIDEVAFMRTYYKSYYKFRKDVAEAAVKVAKADGVTILDALYSLPNLSPAQQSNAKQYSYAITRLSKINDPTAAIDYVLEDLGYQDYIETNELGEAKIGIMRVLAGQEKTIEDFLNRLAFLEMELEKSHTKADAVTFTTVHSSKGLEYDTVYLLDAFDGLFPCNNKSTGNMTRKEYKEYMEERRLFYVAITRAKNKLVVFDIQSLPSKFINEISPSKPKMDFNGGSVRGVLPDVAKITTTAPRNDAKERQRRIAERLKAFGNSAV